jgi:hypothetical protein
VHALLHRIYVCLGKQQEPGVEADEKQHDNLFSASKLLLEGEFFTNKTFLLVTINCMK